MQNIKLCKSYTDCTIGTTINVDKKRNAAIILKCKNSNGYLKRSKVMHNINIMECMEIDININYSINTIPCNTNYIF
jgi:hypothetical protein